MSVDSPPELIAYHLRPELHPSRMDWLSLSCSRALEKVRLISRSG
jgi:hypothetical protein